MELVFIVKKIVLFMIPFILSLSVHEFAHAWMAFRLGDRTAKFQGRLTLDPRAHLDLFGSIIFPILSIIMPSALFFGWGKPVPVNPRSFLNPKKGMMWVAAAGPISNVILAIISAIGLKFLKPFLLANLSAMDGPSAFTIVEPIVLVLQVMISLNIALAFFNLIPIPPLDGSRILVGILPYRHAEKIYRFEQYGFFVLMVLMVTGIFRVISIPASLCIQFLTQL